MVTLAFGLTDYGDLLSNPLYGFATPCKTTCAAAAMQW